MNKLKKIDSDAFYQKVAELLAQARSSVVQTINRTMVQTYFKVGQMIIEEEQGGNIRAEYGKNILIELSQKN